MRKHLEKGMFEKTLEIYFGMEGPKDYNRFHVRLKCPLACNYPETAKIPIALKDHTRISRIFVLARCFE
jgi:hypothetical protein